MKTLITIMLFAFSLVTGMSAQKNAQSFTALKIDSKTSTILLKINTKTDAYKMVKNEMHVVKGFKIVFDKNTDSYVFLKEKEDINDYPVMTRDGTIDMGGGVKLRCVGSRCGSGCSPGSNSDANGTVYFCSSCPDGGCSPNVYVPSSSARQHLTEDGDDWMPSY